QPAGSESIHNHRRPAALALRSRATHRQGEAAGEVLPGISPLAAWQRRSRYRAAVAGPSSWRTKHSARESSLDESKRLAFTVPSHSRVTRAGEFGGLGSGIRFIPRRSMARAVPAFVTRALRPALYPFQVSGTYASSISGPPLLASQKLARLPTHPSGLTPFTNGDCAEPAVYSACAPDCSASRRFSARISVVKVF